MTIERVVEEERKAQITKDILSSLPEWFGIPESTKEYIEGCRNKPFWVAKVNMQAVVNDKAEVNEQAVGFICLKECSKYTAEVYVMGIKKEQHQKGIGRKLFAELYDYAKEHGYEFLQVKTVEQGRYEEYDCTNLFYKAVGFKEFECFPTLWDEANPCRVYVMHVD